MDITLEFHIEAVGGGEVSWWAESDDLPGVTMAAESLLELREMIAQVLDDLGMDRGEEIVVVAECLSGGAEGAERPDDVQHDLPAGTMLSAVGAPAHRVLIPA